MAVSSELPILDDFFTELQQAVVIDNSKKASNILFL